MRRGKKREEPEKEGDGNNNTKKRDEKWDPKKGGQFVKETEEEEEAEKSDEEVKCLQNGEDRESKDLTEHFTDSEPRNKSIRGFMLFGNVDRQILMLRNRERDSRIKEEMEMKQNGIQNLHSSS